MCGLAIGNSRVGISVLQRGQISIAPMIDVTDRYFRYLTRLMTKKTILYTEMICAQSAIQNNSLLEYDKIEHPVVIQLGNFK